MVNRTVLQDPLNPNDGTRLIALAHIVNIGEHVAVQPVVRLENIPADWVVEPETKIPLNNIRPGLDRYQAFKIFKGQSNSTIFAIAGAKNAPEVSSEHIPVPVFALVGAALAGCFMGLTHLARKPKKR